MLIEEVRPTTLAGIKRLAGQLRKAHGLKQAAALDQAARAAHYQNYRNALRSLPKRGEDFSRPYLFLTIYWQDKEKGYAQGRETLKVELSRPILNLCTKSALKRVRGFGNLRMVANDHFVCDMVAHTQIYARDQLNAAERSLRFVEATGLRPVKSGKAIPRILDDDRLPGKDHATNWYDPVTEEFVLIDEPYGAAPDDAKRKAWAERHGWRVVKSTWPGMYRPYECNLFVVAKSGTNLDTDSLVRTIDKMPIPVREGEWHGESVSSWETFTSPMATTPQDARRARSRGTIYPTSSATTLPYTYSLGDARRRPAGRLGVDGHQEVGAILKAILTSSRRPYDVYRRLNSVRSDLEDWMSLELSKSELDRLDFFGVYYREGEGDQPYEETANSTTGLISMLGTVLGKLQASYPDCKPLRDQLNRITTSMELLRRMEGAEA